MAEPHQDDDFGLPVGERLRRAREAKGLTLDDVAAQTRIPIRHLRSIEDSNWSELPAITYTIGFGRSYANVVGLDGAQIGRELRDQLGGAPRTSQMSTEYYAPPDPARVPSRSVAWIAGILALALVAGYLLLRSPSDGNDQAAVEPVPTTQMDAPQQPAAPSPADFTGQQVTLVATAEAWVQIDDQAGGGRLQTATLTAGQQYAVPLSARQPIIRTRRPQVLRVRIGERDFGPLAAQETLITGQTLLAADLARQLGGQGQAAPTQQPAAANGFQPAF